MQQMQRVQSFGKAQSQKGFTIIELVVVILLLGILAATALPRFMDVTDEAHDAVFEGTVGGFTTGVALFRAQYIGKGEVSPVVLDNASLVFNSYGYPEVLGPNDTPNFVNAETSAAACVAIFNSVLQAGRPSISVDIVTPEFALGDPATLAATDFDFTEVVATDFRVGFFDTVGATPPPGVVASPVCYYVYTAQYQTDADAVAAGRTGLPYFTYAPYTGEIQVLHTANL